jgi:hypothetical protein
MTSDQRYCLNNWSSKLHYKSLNYLKYLKFSRHLLCIILIFHRLWKMCCGCVEGAGNDL